MEGVDDPTGAYDATGPCCDAGPEPDPVNVVVPVEVGANCVWLVNWLAESWGNI